MTDTDSDDYPAERFVPTRTFRKSTKLEIGLVIILLGQFGSGVWWARGVSSQLDTLEKAIALYDPGANAVLQYRVTQLERELAAVRAMRR
jgi:hypothetical protein